jgi:hypothetical protein
MIARIATLIIAVSCALLVACYGQGRQVDKVENPGGDPDTIYFPRQEKSNSFDAADVYGTIQLVDGCPRLVEAPSNDYLIIFPHGFELRVQSEEIVVLNGQGTPVARIGDRVVLGGSGNPNSSDDEIHGCSGPFWNGDSMVLQPSD